MKGSELTALVALLPFFLVVAVSFVKFAVVLGILRRALGGGAIPPAGVTSVLALVFALFVAAPVGERAWSAAAPLVAKGDGVGGAERAAEPVREFLRTHSAERERQSFLELAKKLRSPTEKVEEGDLTVVAPAFVTGELKAAFRVGFFIFLPFLLLELLAGIVLAALGLGGTSSEMVSLPFKLLLFVAVDGWHLLFRGLVLGGAQ